MNQAAVTNLKDRTNGIGTQPDYSGVKYKDASLTYEDATAAGTGDEMENEDYREMEKGSIGNETTVISDNFANLSQLEEKDLKVAITRLRRQNEALRDQLKDLSLKLTDVLDKAKNNKPKKDDRPQEFKEDTLNKEIENSKQQINHVKNELEHLRNRLELCSSEDRLLKLEVILRQRDQMIQDLMIENKNLQKINRDQEKEIDAYFKDQGFENKVTACSQEVKSLRDKLRDYQAVSRMNEKNFKKQQEYLTNLNHQYAIVAEKVGVPVSFTFAKLEELEDYIKKAQKGNANYQQQQQQYQQQQQQQQGEIKRNVAGQLADMDSKQVKMMQEKIKDLQTREEILQKQLLSLERKNQLTLSKLKSEIAEIQNNSREAESKIAQKEQEIAELDRKVTDLKFSAKKNAANMLEPLRYSGGSERPNNDGSPRITGEPRNGADKSPVVTKSNNTVIGSPAKTNMKTVEVPMVRDVLGGRTGQGLFEFSDKDIVENIFSTKIVKVTVWLGELFINGIQASYRINNSEDIMGNQHLASEMKGKTKVVESLQVDPDDRISYVAGKYTEGLTCLKFQTLNGKIKVFGDQKSPGEEFEISMESAEQPTLLFGSLCKRKDKKGKEEIVLANVGFTLMKKVLQQQQQQPKK